MRFFLVIFLIVASFLRSSAQGYEDNTLYSPPSPTANGLLKYANVPISPYTGTPAINLPITALKTRNGSIPVSLQYAASGTKVQEIPSWVGLGWSVNAGGVITRVLRGLPDENANGYCGTNNIGEKAENPLTVDYVKNVYLSTWDGEPDLFYFNFMGYTGRFVLDAAGLPVLTPHSNLKIIPAICPQGEGQKWTVTDPNGVIYIFGQDENSKETTNSKISGTSGSGTTYISSWYLSEITYPQGNETISFAYAAGASISYKYYAQVNKKEIYRSDPYFTGCKTGDGTTSDRDIEVTINSPRYLDQITSSYGRIKFVLNPVSREDLAGAKSLQKIMLYDYSSQLIDTYQLAYGYFESDGCSSELCKRLKLANVTRGSSGTSFTLYSFEYNSTNLPARNSHAIDHWGYYNSNTFDGKVPQVDDTGAECGLLHQGADKSPDSLRSRANILTKIFNTTGGHTEFVYSAHQYMDNTSNNQIAGGARIRILRECTDSNNCRDTYYYYKKFNDALKSSGIITALPTYYNRGESFVVVPMTPTSGYFRTSVDVTRTSQPVNQLFEVDGHHIGYSNVMVRINGQGYTRYYYTDRLTNSDESPDQFVYSISRDGGGNYTIGEFQHTVNPNDFPHTPSSSKSWERGLEDKVEVYSETHKLLTSELYKYKFDLSEIKRVPAYKIGLRAYTSYTNFYAMGKYFAISKPFTLEKVTTTHYDQTTPVSDLSTQISNVVEYAYDMEVLLPTTVTSYNSTYPSQKKIVVNKYVNHPDYRTRVAHRNACEEEYADCREGCGHDGNCIDDCIADRSNCLSNTTPTADTEAVELMYTKRQWSRPVESQMVLLSNGQQKLLNAAVTKFSVLKPDPSDASTYYVVPNEIFSGSPGVVLGQYASSNISVNGAFNLDNTKLRKTASLDSYDLMTGNILSMKGSDGIPKVAVWGFSNNYIQTLTTNPNNPAPGSADVQHQASFNYRPLIGLISATDPNLKSTHFEYDGFGNLLMEKNSDSHITKRYRNNYVNGNQFSTDFTIGGARIKNSPLNFSFNDLKTVGNTRYVWDFGDGVVVNDASSNVNHAFTNSGTYTVKLAKSNPEFGSIIASKQVTVVGPPLLNTISTPNNADFCTAAYSSCTLSTTVTDGCQIQTLQWYQIFPNGYESPIGTGTQVSFLVESVGTHEFKCVATDVCGQTGVGYTAVVVYRGDPNCPN
jgi:YD repeat-containing protein